MDAVEFLKQYSRMVASGVQPFAVPSKLPYEEIVAHSVSRGKNGKRLCAFVPYEY